jgi:hypothetical protein
MHRLPVVCSLFACGVLAAVPAQSAELVTGLTYTPTPDASPEPDTTDVASITTGASPSSVTYTDLLGATAESVSLASNGLVFYAQSDTTAPTAVQALSGLEVTDGAANVTNVKLDLNTVVSQANGYKLFWLDYNSEGPTTFYPLDNDGDRIGDFEYVAPGTGSVQAQQFDYNGVGNSGISGLVFDLSDFTGTGSLDNVFGLEMVENGAADPVAFGTIVPEPASLALLAAGGLCLLPRRRR